jgi:hypothetical protein
MAGGKEKDKRCKSKYGYAIFHCIGHRTLDIGVVNS